MAYIMVCCDEDYVCRREFEVLGLDWKLILCAGKGMGWKHSTKSDTDSYDIEGMEDGKIDCNMGFFS